ncbi:hypothetical protein SAMN02799624_02403 [Paenibacillus sp. UNC496MF]|nr:hypothetical protein SAMN02799624_02403 [Paenibacillus sp. UNC496MF]
MRRKTAAASSSEAAPIVQNGTDQWAAASQLPIGTPKAWEAARPEKATPIAFGMRDAGMTAGIDAHTCGAVNAALTPARKRSRHIVQKPSAKPHSAVAAEKPSRPHSMTVRRFQPSDSGPAIKAKRAEPSV